MHYSIFEISQIVSGKYVGNEPETRILNLSFDSRQIGFPENTLFIALEGTRKNGHEFIKELLKRGVTNFLISQPDYLEYGDRANFVLVPDTLVALQQIAAFHRSQFTYPVIGITGSNGKTIVKEWLYQLLYDKFNLVKSPRSFNSQLGVPLSVWQMDDEDTLAIFEAGISQKGEMEKLRQIINPDIGIFTYLGDAHNAGFKDLKEKLKEKLSLFKYTKTLIYCADQDIVADGVANHYKGETLGWSFMNKGNLAIDLKLNGLESQIKGKYKKTKFVFKVPFTDYAALTNITHCIVTALFLGVTPEELTQLLDEITSINMRLQVKEGINDCMIVDDSYNADLDSLKIALQFLDQQGQKSLKTVIISDLLQSGIKAEQLYKKVGGLLTSFKIDKVISVGNESALLKDWLPDKTAYRHFKTTRSFVQHCDSSDFQHEAILVKGARPFAFESIVQVLSKRSHRTVLEVNLSGLVHNLNVYASLLSEGVKMMVMVKASAYGAGSDEVAKLLQYHKVDYLCVAYPDEGADLRKAGIKLPIMVLNPDEESISTMVSNNLEPEIYSLSILDAIIAYFPTGSNGIGIHIKLDTGMNRLGFTEETLDDLIERLEENPMIRVMSIFTHLSASENPIHDEFTHTQYKRFKKYSDRICSVLDYKPLLHVLNTSGISRFKEYQLDMVRPGIGLYGYDANPKVNTQLKNIHTLKALISQIRVVPANETIGYGRGGRLTKKTRIATISIGYADGFQRKLGNGNYSVLVQGKEAKTIGNVCMDMTMLDINHIPEAKEGDEVIIFGDQLPVTKMAQALGTIPYEIFTGIANRVKRVYFQE